jgi:hypothetical protein
MRVSAMESVVFVPAPDDLHSVPSVTARALRWSSASLMAVTWLSAGIFGAYILSYYGLAVPLGRVSEWNRKLPGLYDAATPLATLGIGLHFVAGAALLLLGPLQFFARIRVRTPAVHRWVGRIYAGAALIAGVGGLVYIAEHGTIGGAPMSVGFCLYGALVALSATQTLRHAYARRFDLHRAWAIRLYALAIGSWLYRMDYGFWLLFANGRGHTRLRLRDGLLLLPAQHRRRRVGDPRATTKRRRGRSHRRQRGRDHRDRVRAVGNVLLRALRVAARDHQTSVTEGGGRRRGVGLDGRVRLPRLLESAPRFPDEPF